MIVADASAFIEALGFIGWLKILARIHDLMGNRVDREQGHGKESPSEPYPLGMPLLQFYLTSVILRWNCKPPVFRT